MDIQTWLPLVGVVIGYGLAYFGDWRKEGRAAEREREVRRKERQYAAITEAQDLLGERYLLEEKMRIAAARHQQVTGRLPQGDEFEFDGKTVFASISLRLRLISLGFRIEDEELRAAICEANYHAGQMTQGGQQQSDKSADASIAAMKRFDERARIVLAELH